MPKINLSGVGDFEAIPDGEYDAKLEAWEWVDAEENKSGKFGYLKLTFTVTDEEHEGRKMFRNYSSSPNALWALKRVLIRLGCDPDDITDDDGIDLDDVMPELIGAEVVLKLAQREYEGEMRNEVKDVKSPAMV